MIAITPSQGGVSTPVRPILQQQLCDSPNQHNNVHEISVLTSLDAPANKRFFIDEQGEVDKISFRNPYKFNVAIERASGLHDLAEIISRCSGDSQKLLVRGLPTDRNKGIYRRNETFHEHELGTPWVMLDFDDIAVGDGMDPLSGRAIEYLIGKLPAEFQNVSYFYQHSASAGILKSDGTRMKQGINAHLFFWLCRPVEGEVLSAYLTNYCMQTGFYELGESSAGVVELVFGIDPATIRSHVQPHFIAAPTIDPGVISLLDNDNRQHLIQKSLNYVQIPALSGDCVQNARREKSRLVDVYKQANGYKHQVMMTSVGERTALVRHSVAPPRCGPAPLRTERPFEGAMLSSDEKYLTLYFSDESSPGSWYVAQDRPQLARRHGDGAELPLKELSVGAHEYVRDKLEWFREIPHQYMALVDGYLPRIEDFALAKVSLILSPTGSGKSTAAIEWIKAQIRGKKLVFYTAPTIALVHQMEDDLKAAGLDPIYYETAKRAMKFPKAGVIVSTNKSLPALLKVVQRDAMQHAIVFDEIHQALDEFMRHRDLLISFEKALLCADKSLLLTGTLTDIQRLALVDVVKEALGRITVEGYNCYEFLAYKQNPIHIVGLNCFQTDLVALLGELSAKQSNGEPLPRVVMLMDTSRMEAYKILIRQYGLEEQALIVSRPESTPEEIEEARTSDKPILISSPLFGLGLNFQHQPDMLWCRYDKVNADTSQIIQSVNRANRGKKTAEVRIYGNHSADSQFWIPRKDLIKLGMRENLLQETTLAGLIEEHLHIDRIVYNLLRECERNSHAALSLLVRENAVQNFVITPREVPPDYAPGKETVVTDAFKAARGMYEAATQSYFDGLRNRNVVTNGLSRLESLQNERINSWHGGERRTERDFESEGNAILMGLCAISDPKGIQYVDVNKLQRLFCEKLPWLSPQYAPSRYEKWAEATAEKTGSLLILIDKLADLASGKTNVDALSASLTRNPRFKEAILALSNSDLEYQGLIRQFKKLKTDRERVRLQGGEMQRNKIEQYANKLLDKVLKSIGVTYAKVKIKNHLVEDRGQPIVPSNWNLPEMRLELRRQAERLKALPLDQNEYVKEFRTSINNDDPPPVCRSVCEPCVFFRQSACVRGLEVEWQGYASQGVLKECNLYHRLKPELAHSFE